MSENEGMFYMVFGHASDPIIGQEFMRAEEPLQHATQLPFVHNREFVLLLAFDVMTATFGQVPAIIHEPQKVVAKLFEGINIFKFQCFGSIKRDDADQGTHAELLNAPVWKPKDIVEEAIILVPERVISAAHILHGGSNVDVVLEELQRETLIRLVVYGQLQGYSHQVKTEH